jgi:hypothetical protein
MRKASRTKSEGLQRTWTVSVSRVSRRNSERVESEHVESWSAVVAPCQMPGVHMLHTHVGGSTTLLRLRVFLPVSKSVPSGCFYRCLRLIYFTNPSGIR